jgi:hypothetical protein
LHQPFSCVGPQIATSRSDCNWAGSSGGILHLHAKVGRSLDITIYKKDDQVFKTGMNKEVGVFYGGAGVGFED